jgi:hypothetical protein
VFHECSSILPWESEKRYAPGLDFSVTTDGSSQFDSSLLELSMRGLRKRTRSPTSKVLCFTFLSLHALVSIWYFYKLITALSLSDSNKSLSSTLVVQGMTYYIVWELLCLISSGVTALAPNNSRNGEKFVTLETDVL